MNLDSLTTQDLMAVGVSMFNNHSTTGRRRCSAAGGAEPLEPGRASTTWPNTQLALKQWDKLAETGKQLVRWSR